MIGLFKPVLGRDDRLGRKLNPLDSILGENVLDSGVIAALGKPEASGCFAENPDMALYTELDLSPDGSLIVSVEREIGVGCGCCDKLHPALFRKLSVAGQDVPSVVLIESKIALCLLQVECCDLEDFGCFLFRPGDFLFSQFDPGIQVCDEPLLEGFIETHRREGR